MTQVVVAVSRSLIEVSYRGKLIPKGIESVISSERPMNT